jgi:hypothetical protein
MVLCRILLLAVTLSFADASPAAPPSDATRSEISHLLDYLEHSGCDFFRNGSWYSSHEARAHLEKKNNYLMNRSLITSAEDFVEHVASFSSVSGEKYMVRCKSNEPVLSSSWLQAELHRFRSRQSGKKK